MQRDPVFASGTGPPAQRLGWCSDHRRRALIETYSDCGSYQRAQPCRPQSPGGWFGHSYKAPISGAFLPACARFDGPVRSVVGNKAVGCRAAPCRRRTRSRHRRRPRPDCANRNSVRRATPIPSRLRRATADGGYRAVGRSGELLESERPVSRPTVNDNSSPEAASSRYVRPWPQSSNIEDPETRSTECHGLAALCRASAHMMK
jgi:hypothetical protein